MIKKYINWIIIVTTIMMTLFSCKSISDIKKQNDMERQIEFIEKEREVGRASFAKIAGKYGIVKDKEVTEYINKLGKSLGLYTERQDIEYFFAILDTDTINAYALPGGYILITRGAINSVPDQAAFMGVIAHEMGHINLKHILKRVKIQVKFNFFELLARILAGPRQVITAVAGQISDKIEEELFIKGLDSEDEFEADNYAVTLMQGLNISAESYLNYLSGIHQNRSAKDLENLDATHPDINERISKISAKIDSNIKSLPDSDGFKEFKSKIANFKSDKTNL